MKMNGRKKTLVALEYVHDDLWAVSTKPHHVHRRGEKQGRESNMTGNPKIDMPYLIGIVEKYLI